ncbi:MAG TPA: C45 family peptidase [Chitinophagaceae bacterium]|nr:C45 family peptidase [Chitinophagaceae bacterium]
MQKNKKNRKLKKWLLILLSPILLLLALLLLFLIWVWLYPEPKGPDLEFPKKENYTQINDSLRKWKDNWYIKSASGHHILYVKGSPEEMGQAQGILSQDLIKEQEIAFTEEIQRMIPSTSYLSFLKYIVKIINKDLEKNVLPIYQKEIKAISEYADPQFNWIGSNYARLLNYHSAHDIGHALQNLMLVGCTSFATWDEKSENGHLLVGRNFDFYVGDAFAENKIVLIAEPDSGYAYSSITWGGFIGVVSGINEKGLSVTINAAPSEIPKAAATPVSLVAREVLQFATNIEEAYAIIEKRKMFVSESFLIASAEDGFAVTIEKTPTETKLYRSNNSDYITCTNHYQTEELSIKNPATVLEDASFYRSKKTNYLIQENAKISIYDIAEILRDFSGLNSEKLGLGNEKAINQFIAHHSIIFDNKETSFWLSTYPWQMGKFMHYNLIELLSKSWMDFSDISFNKSIAASDKIEWESFKNFILFKEKQNLWQHKKWPIKNIEEVVAFIKLNPDYFYTWELAGDMALSINDLKSATNYYTIALEKNIANNSEKERIEKKIKKIDKDK